jgi:VWFA-related protein
MRVIVCFAALALLGSTIAGAQDAQQGGRFVERVEVRRVIVDVRVLDDTGQPVMGLEPDDFEVHIDGERARVDSLSWTGAGDIVAAEPSRSSAGGTGERPPPGRLIVFLIQKDLQAIRMRGLLRMLLESRRFLDTLGAADRVAVVSFDSHLKLWTDFTNDRRRLETVFSEGVIFDRGLAFESRSGPSLFARLDSQTARRTYGIEKALQLIADALRPLPGAKSLVLIGYGFGRFGPMGMTMEREYDFARRALVEARTSVFSLDTTDADFHSLEAGLELVADNTGGFFARTHTNSMLAMKRLAGALAGSYALFVEMPASDRASHDIRVRLTRRSGSVLAKTGFDE